MPKPCVKCGSTERYPPTSGRRKIGPYIACHSARSKARWKQLKTENPSIFRDRYKQNKAAILKHNKAYKLRTKETVYAAKDRPCMDCGVRFPVVCMDFDHRPGEQKLDCVGTLVTRRAA